MIERLIILFPFYWKAKNFFVTLIKVKLYIINSLGVPQIDKLQMYVVEFFYFKDWG